jgi:[histone H3]-lysine36 N-trimethyltransferase
MQLFPHVKSVTDKYRHKLPKEELKKFAKEINKKLVASDYKNNRVADPTHISSKQEKKIRSYVKDFFERAAKKYQDHERRKAERAARLPTNGDRDSSPKAEADEAAIKEEADLMDDGALSDIEDASPSSSVERKRKRDGEDEVASASVTPSETPSMKRLKEEDLEAPSPPPPPPPPPEGAGAPELSAEREEMEEMQAALMRENEEAQRLEDEAERHKMREEEAALQRENEEALRDFELSRRGDVDVEMKEAAAAELNGDEGQFGAMDIDGNGQKKTGNSALTHEIEAQ